MSYRDEAELGRRVQLVEALARETDWEQREQKLDELAALDRVRRIEMRRRLPMIANARIASPCEEPFEAMTGQGAVRQCARCDREVFDVARMTLAEAESLVTARACVRLTKRRDGTMMFADCEVGARGIQRRRVGAMVAGVVIAATAAAVAIAPRRPQFEHERPPATRPVRPISTSGVHYVHETPAELPALPEATVSVLGQMSLLRAGS